MPLLDGLTQRASQIAGQYRAGMALTGFRLRPRYGPYQTTPRPPISSLPVQIFLTEMISGWIHSLHSHT